MLNILITGQKSYVGTSLKKFLLENPEKYNVEMLSMRDDEWKKKDFHEVDAIVHLAAIVHKKEKKILEQEYFKVNKHNTIELARIAKAQGVKKFIFMSSMAVYGQEGHLTKEIVIDETTAINPKTLYGLTKYEAEKYIYNLKNKDFKVAILRPPLIYGPNCPGNYKWIDKISKLSPIFPLVENKRSMVHVENLCIFIKKCIDNNDSGLYFPQDEAYVNVSIMVQKLAKEKGKKIHLSKTLGKLIYMFGKNNSIVNKVFGNLMYAHYNTKENEGATS